MVLIEDMARLVAVSKLPQNRISKTKHRNGTEVGDTGQVLAWRTPGICSRGEHASP